MRLARTDSDITEVDSGRIHCQFSAGESVRGERKD